MKFAFVHAEKASFKVSTLCRLLGVSRQGYYSYAKRRCGTRVEREINLRERVRSIHDASKQTYGSPRVLAALRRSGMPISKRRVERAMRSLGLCVRPKRRFRITTAANPKHAVEPNILARDFTATRPNERWVTDITYVWTDEGWCYVAAIIDLFSRAVVGWAIDTTLSTSLPLRALDSAVRSRKPAAGLIHHSDRGCQYTSTDYRAALAALGVCVSMSRKGNCWDNAVAESFFATLKTELVHRRRWTNGLELRAALFEYIEVFYNRQRLHSSLDYDTPAEVESAYTLANAA